jgi:hypothetical protein
LLVLHQQVSSCLAKFATDLLTFNASALAASYQIISYQTNVAMSEVAKPAEATPPAPAVAGTDSTPVPSTAPAPATSESTPATDTITSAGETPPAEAKEETVKDGEAKVEATPASEGILGYKGPRLIQ